MQTFYTSHMFPSLNRGNPKSWYAIVVDSFIVAGITFFSTLSVTQWPPRLDILWAAGIAFGLTFFTQMAVERGLKFTPGMRQGGGGGAGDNG